MTTDPAVTACQQPRPAVTVQETRPPIPSSLAHRPVTGGLACPWVNVELADGGVDFRSAHHARFERCWLEGLCQSCGNPAGDPSVLLCGPRHLLSRRFDEPPLCPPCALYAGKACPMVSGSRATYATRQRVSAGRRGEQCSIPGCGCGGWVVCDPENSAAHGGDPAHPWYALWVHPAALQVTAHKTVTRCSDLGCEHERVIVNGALLTRPPLKVFLVSEPGEGRAWRRFPLADAAAHATAWLERQP